MQKNPPRLLSVIYATAMRNDPPSAPSSSLRAPGSSQPHPITPIATDLLC